MTRKTIRNENIIAHADKAQSIAMPWARGARRQAMIARRTNAARKTA